MTNYDKFFKENGFLTPEGDQIMKEKFLPIVQELLSSMETENQVRIMAGMLSNLTGKTAADTIQSRRGPSSENSIKETINTHFVDPFENFIAKAQTSEDFQKINASLQDALQSLTEEGERLKKKIAENPMLNALNKNFKEFEDWVEEHIEIKNKEVEKPKENENKSH